MHKPHTILVVDDDLRCRELLLNVLEPEGYRVLVAVNGREALVQAMTCRPDVVLLDVTMPDMDGFEVCRTLRADRTFAHLPIIFTTALEDKRSRLKGIEAGADDFVTKPIDIAELRTRLRSVTRLNRFRLQAEERLRFEQVVAFSPDAIVITDDHGRIHLSNTAFSQMMGEEAPVLNLLEEIRGEDLPKVRHLLTLAATSSRRYPVEVHFSAPRERLVEMSVGALPWEGQKAWQFCLRDITEKKQLEQQLLRTQRLDLLGQLAGGVIHDVNNLLSSIAAQAALMGMDTVTSDQAERLSSIEMASYQGGGLLRQLLLFARGRDGDTTDLDTVSHLCEFHTMVKQALGERVQVDVDVVGTIPSVKADGNQVFRVLMNLCVNARDAMPSGGRILLRLKHEHLSDDDGSRLQPAVPAGDYVIYEVSDTGGGIPASVREHMFEPFFTTKPTGKGTGLGLATVQRVMHRHQGYVTVESRLGQGTTFRCFFPLALQPTEAEVITPT